MRILIVTFELKDLTDSAYRQAADGAAAAFAAVPGLERKYFLADEGSNTYGGVYVFETDEAVAAYLEGDLVASMRANPHFANVTIREFGIVEGATAITVPAERVAA